MVVKRHKAVLRVSLIELLCQEAQSIFRYGFDYLRRGASPLGRRIFFDLNEHQADFLQSLQFLSCT
jgi:hypothetical protein